MKLSRRRWDVGKVPYPKAYGRCVKACISEGRSRRVLTLEANLALCPPAISQYAALEAFTPESRVELDAHVADYARARDVLLQELPSMGLGNFAPPVFTSILTSPISPMIRNNGATNYCMTLVWPLLRG